MNKSKGYKKERKEVTTIVHAHPVFASAFTAMKCKIEVLENASKMTLVVELTKKKNPLSKSRVSEIKKLFR